eukprot:TRINITY_DN12089_c0_g1_i1.p1 TRINITY_DN12089_c0_g1~~TRINITY_DN12089_c0_g1_i1.p1  ORF type:complete len:349 (+),score=97.60 TRINITY_DN12089_c0_g1_i1:649-1695(+)
MVLIYGPWDLSLPSHTGTGTMGVCNMCEASEGDVMCVECGMMVYCSSCSGKLHQIEALKGHALEAIGHSDMSDDYNPEQYYGSLKEGDEDWALLTQITKDSRRELGDSNILQRELKELSHKEEQVTLKAVNVLSSEFKKLHQMLNEKEEEIGRDLEQKWDERYKEHTKVSEGLKDVQKVIAECEDVASALLLRSRVNCDDIKLLRQRLDLATDKKNDLEEELLRLKGNTFDARGDLQSKYAVQAIAELAPVGAVKPPGWMLLKDTDHPITTRPMRSQSPHRSPHVVPVPMLHSPPVRAVSATPPRRRVSSSPNLRQIHRTMSGFSPTVMAAFETSSRNQRSSPFRTFR